MTREAFVRMMTSGLAAPPRYFPRDAEINRQGARPLSEIHASHLTPGEARELVRGGAVVLDVRDAAAFSARHADGAINIGLRGQFASWCGTLLAMDDPMIVVASNEAEANEAVMRLARVGLENVRGWIGAGEELPSRTIPQISVRDLAATPRPVLDVRRAGEYETGHVPGATNVPLDELPQRLGEVPRDSTLAVICAGGYRSSVACSLLARAGFANVINVTGGTGEWVRAGLPVER
jgi:rhodanese-related sulfurtransferase